MPTVDGCEIITEKGYVMWISREIPRDLVPYLIEAAKMLNKLFNEFGDAVLDIAPIVLGKYLAPFGLRIQDLVLFREGWYREIKLTISSGVGTKIFIKVSGPHRAPEHYEVVIS